MANQWLRLWHDMPTDPKWRTIARASGQSIGDVMAVYLFVLVDASNATERGRTQSINCEDIASALDVRAEQVASIIDAMQGRVLDNDVVMGWEKRQVAREDGAAERSKAWRAAKKAENERNQSQPNASERKRTPDKDKDKDKEIKDIDAPQAGVESKTKRKCRIPVDLALNADRTTAAVEYWKTKNRLDLDPVDQFQKFINHFTGNGKPMLDWDACWRTWYTNAITFTRPSVIGNGQTGIGSNGAAQRDNSAVGRVRANAQRELAERASTGPQFDNPPLDAYDGDVRPQVDESVRGRDRPEQCVGSVIEGDFKRTN